MSNLFQGIEPLRQALAPARQAGRRIGFVPTMGALHPGHLSLVAQARRACDVVVASVFVNPRQFGPAEDFENYPRRLAADAALLSDAGVDAVFGPKPAELYAPTDELVIAMPQLGQVGEGVPRPHFFNGVALVVTKLLNIVQPHAAYFGLKDYQQYILIRKMLREMCLGVEVVGCPIVREADGLAMSSRNELLSPDERRLAPRLFGTLRAVARHAATLHTTERARAYVAETLGAGGAFRLDYFEVRDADTFAELPTLAPEGQPLMLVAAWLGRTRLIDNLLVHGTMPA